MSDIAIYAAKAALSARIAQYEADIERYRLAIAEQAPLEGSQHILALVYGWQVATGVAQALDRIAAQLEDLVDHD